MIMGAKKLLLHGTDAKLYHWGVLLLTSKHGKGRVQDGFINFIFNQ
jgi:hypothetical protein